MHGSGHEGAVSAWFAEASAREEASRGEERRETERRREGRDDGGGGELNTEPCMVN